VDRQLESPESEDPGGVGTAPGNSRLDPPPGEPGDPDLETGTVPDALVSEFSSLTTPYCWVITEDLIAGYDGAEPSAVGKSGPEQAEPADVYEALTAGKFFRLVGQGGSGLAIGRLYDPAGDNERAPLDDFGRKNWGAITVEYRLEGQWQAD
jgi:hypothetical protein